MARFDNFPGVLRVSNIQINLTLIKPYWTLLSEPIYQNASFEKNFKSVGKLAALNSL